MPRDAAPVDQPLGPALCAGPDSEAGRATSHYSESLCRVDIPITFRIIVPTRPIHSSETGLPLPSRRAGNRNLKPAGPTGDRPQETRAAHR